MKILYLISSVVLNPEAKTGYGRHIRETVNGLADRGHEVVVLRAGEFSFKDGGVSIHEKLGKSIWKKLVPGLIWETIKDIRQLMVNARFKKQVISAIKEHHPDLVYERTSYLSDTITINVNYQLPWYLEVNSPFIEQRVKLSGKSLLVIVASLMEKRKFALATHTFCVSGVLANYILKEFEALTTKVSVNHNGVNTNDFITINQIKDESDDFIFGFVGSIMPYHGIDLLIEAFANVQGKIQSPKLLIVGDGLAIPDLKRKAVQLGVADQVQFTGGVSQKEIPRLIDEMDVCILPQTAWYCSPIKLFEYGIKGKPIIAPSVDSVAEILIDGVDGLLIDGVNELEKSMQFYFDNPLRAQEMAGTFKSKVLTNYTWNNNMEKIQKVLTEHLN